MFIGGMRRIKALPVVDETLDETTGTDTPPMGNTANVLTHSSAADGVPYSAPRETFRRPANVAAITLPRRAGGQYVPSKAC
jgi:hypothetical protein